MSSIHCHFSLGAWRSCGAQAVRFREFFVCVLLVGGGWGCASTLGGSSDSHMRAGADAAVRQAWEEAEFRWLKALAIGPESARALNNLAVRHEHLGEFEKAAGHYSRALQIATEEERPFILGNDEQFRPILSRISVQEGNDGGTNGAMVPSDVGGTGQPVNTTPATSEQAAAASAVALESSVRTLTVTISVPEEEGPNLAGFDRILVAGFLPSSESELNLNELAVRFFRRRIVQRTFFQTADLLDRPLPEAGDQLLDDQQFWVERAALVDADLVLTGRVGLMVTDESGIVRERIRSPVTNQIEEVARFREMTAYRVTLDYRLLRGEDGVQIVDGTAEGSRSFPVEDGFSTLDATIEVFEDLLPQLLDAITPRRSDQTRVLIY